ncbi:hypothetical protein ACWCXH_38185 [Kitasatospora sp. NPDC001660]
MTSSQEGAEHLDAQYRQHYGKTLADSSPAELRAALADLTA